MIPWVHLGTAKVPGGNELRLMQRGTEFSIMAGTNELMNSRKSGSEVALATLVCQRLTTVKHPAMLIGGLGMGFTLRAALADLPETAKVDVAELVPDVIAWGRGPMSEIFGRSLDDPRVTLIETDVGALMSRRALAYDAIVLDVDNGPGGITREGNDGLYTTAGLRLARAALKPSGILAIWSAHPDPVFAKRLARSGFALEEIPTRAHTKSRGHRHIIWLATKSKSG